MYLARLSYHILDASAYIMCAYNTPYTQRQARILLLEHLPAQIAPQVNQSDLLTCLYTVLRCILKLFSYFGILQH